MGEESLSSSSFQHRFGIVDVLGESSRSTTELIAPSISDSSLSMNSIMFEKDESIVLSRLKKLYPYIDLQVIYFRFTTYLLLFTFLILFFC